MTGLTCDQVDRLVLAVYADGSLDPARRVLGPYRAVLVVLLYLRHNLSQALLAELFGYPPPAPSGGGVWGADFADAPAHAAPHPV